MNFIKTLSLGLIFTASTGCDNQYLIDNMDTFACSIIPYYAADCTDPEVQAKAVSVLENGIVEAQIVCNGTAQTTPGGPINAFTYAKYSATKLHDGSCLSTINYEAPQYVPGAGTVLLPVSGTQLTPRSSADVDTCPVKAYYVPGYEVKGTVENGIITIQSAHCQSNSGNYCKMPVTGNCTGFNTEVFN